jgi:hypothetical protein
MTRAPDRRYNTEAAAQWLSERLGVTFAAKTLTNWRALGKGPAGWEYVGQKPVIRESNQAAFADQAVRAQLTRRHTRLSSTSATNYRTNGPRRR